MRIKEHPVLDFEKKQIIHFYFEGERVEGLQGDTIASALHALGVKVLGQSLFKHRPRGFYCAIGNCASCLMIVDGKPNIKTCTTLLQPNMSVYLQKDKGGLL